MAYKLILTLENFTESRFMELETFVRTLCSNDRKFQQITIKSITCRIKRKSIITLLKSPHVHKKSREQFQFKRFRKKLILQAPTTETLLILKILLTQYVNQTSNIRVQLSQL